MDNSALTVSCFSKIRLVLPFWYRLTRVVTDKRLLNVCVCVCVCSLRGRCCRLRWGRHRKEGHGTVAKLGFSVRVAAWDHGVLILTAHKPSTVPSTAEHEEEVLSQESTGITERSCSWYNLNDRTCLESRFATYWLQGTRRCSYYTHSGRVIDTKARLPEDAKARQIVWLSLAVRIYTVRQKKGTIFLLCASLLILDGNWWISLCTLRNLIPCI